MDRNGVKRAAEKKRFRALSLAARNSLTERQRRDYSEMIISDLINLSCYQEADAILAYISFRNEVDTSLLLERSFADGKAVFAPKVLEKEMAFYRIFSTDDLTAGYQGIMEPAGGQLFETWVNDWISQYKNRQQEQSIKLEETETCAGAMPSVLICLPGAAFDRSCHRIGYGGGFYDRFLERLRQGVERISAGTSLQVDLGSAAQPQAGTDTVCPQVEYAAVALSYSCQVFDKIPWEPHDIRPERIITETGIIGR